MTPEGPTSKVGKKGTTRKRVGNPKSSQKKSEKAGTVATKDKDVAAASGKGSAGKGAAGAKGPSGKGVGQAVAAQSVPGTGPKTPASAVTAKTKELFDLLGGAPKITGTLKKPYPRDRENDWLVSVEVDSSREKDAIKLAAAYPRGQHVVAIIVPISNASESAPWFALDTGEILRSANDPNVQHITVRPFEMADVMGCTEAYVGQLYKRGIVVKHGRGRYDLVETCKLYIEHLKAEAKGKGGQVYSDQRTANLKIKGEREQLKLTNESGELGYIEDFKAEQMELALTYRNAIEAISNDISPKIANKPVHIVKKKLAEEIKTVLEELGIQASNPNAGTTRKATGKKKAPKSGGRQKRSA